jgi:four helix bundle protein
MAIVKTYKELTVWERSMELVKEIYLLTAEFPNTEIYGIISQMRRAAVTIPSNIAEGFGRRSFKASIQFYSIAYASALELETQLIISKDLKMENDDAFEKSLSLLLEVSKMLNVMISKMKKLVKEDS